MESLHLHEVQCPYCGELIEIQTDDSAGEQAYVEDCSVCCRPMEVSLVGYGEDLILEVRRDDE